MKLSIGRAMRLGVKGIKTQVSGRLGGAEIARSEQYHEGTDSAYRPCVPISTTVLPRQTPPTVV